MKKGKVMYKDELKSRRHALIQMYNEEKQAPDCAQVYLDDLRSSIKNIDKQLQWIRNNPEGYEHLRNGD